MKKGLALLVHLYMHRKHLEAIKLGPAAHNLCWSWTLWPQWTRAESVWDLDCAPCAAMSCCAPEKTYLPPFEYKFNQLLDTSVE